MSSLRRTVSVRGRRSLLTAGLLALALSVSATFGATRGQAAGTNSILETGSSLLYPLFNLWVPDYTRVDRGLKITTQSTGSGTGISQSVAGIAQIGASDAYMSDALMRKHFLLNIPLCISLQMVNYGADRPASALARDVGDVAQVPDLGDLSARRQRPPFHADRVPASGPPFPLSSDTRRLRFFRPIAKVRGKAMMLSPRFLGETPLPALRARGRRPAWKTTSVPTGTRKPACCAHPPFSS